MKSLRSLAAAFALAVPAIAIAAGPIVVHRDPGCGCCEQWATQVKAQFKREVRMIDDGDRAALAKRFGIPSAAGSCHTAIIDVMAFEGHVPIPDMKRVLAQRPKGVRGLAVAGMPIGSPGMEMPGMKPQSYDVIAFGTSGAKVFARH